MEGTRPHRNAWLALAETAAALAVALGLTLGASAVIVVGVMLLGPGRAATVEVPLRPIGGIPAERSPDEVLARVVDLSLADEHWLDWTRETPVLGFVGVHSADALERALIDLLPASGYAIVGLDLQPRIDPDRLLTDLRIVLPSLTVQAVCFCALGLLLMRFRVPAAPRSASIPMTLPLPAEGVASPPRRGARRGAAIAWGLAGGLLAVAVGGALGWLLEVVGIPVHEQPILVELLSDPRTLLVLAPWIVLAAPVSEEIFFRGYVFRFLSARAGLAAGVLVSSLLFAAVHLNLSGVPIYAAVGAIFAFTYLRSSSLLSPIAAHVAYNGVLLAGAAVFGV